MLDLEKYLQQSIANRFKELRGDKPVWKISDSQKSAISNIEKCKNNTGNFISGTLLRTYSEHFNIEAEELIFGDEEELENTLASVFLRIYINMIPEENVVILRKKVSAEYLPIETIDSSYVEVFQKLFFSFGDYARWYKIRRFQDNVNKSIDAEMMFKIMILIIGETVSQSFKKTVIHNLFKDGIEAFKFNSINEEFKTWYFKEFKNVIVPTVIHRFKKDTIFKIGFMVNSLIDDFYEETKESFLEFVPVKEFSPPIKGYRISYSDNMTHEQKEEIVDEIIRMLVESKNVQSETDVKQFHNSEFFKGMNSVKDTSTPLVDETRKESIQELLDSIIYTALHFNELHILDDNSRKIPGIFDVNQQATKIFQQYANGVFIRQINELVSIQNAYIRLIEHSELSSFL